MKKNIFIKGLAGLAVAAAITPALTSCSSDYLDLAPITTLTDGNLMTMQGCKAAYVGMMQTMYQQYTFGSTSAQSSYRCPNGEPWLRTFVGNTFGGDQIPYTWIQSDNTCNWYVNRTIFRSETSWFASYPYRILYNYVNRANFIIDAVESMDINPEDQDEANFYLASALAMRAHAYTMLLQIYAPRWEDSNNGNQGCIVLRLHKGVENLPIVSMNDVLGAIYEDLDNAISLFDNTSYKAEEIWMINGSVARGLKARAAMLKHDYPTAQKMAHDARQGYTIMTADQYTAGFTYANQEWMWGSPLQSTGIFYYAFGSLNAVNANYTIGWGGSNAIDYDLYRTMSETDVRRDLFLTPELVDKYAPTYASTVTGADMWKTTTISRTLVKLNTSSKLYTTFMKNYGQSKDCLPNGVAGTATGAFGKGAYLTNPFSTSSSAVCANIQFGAQFKFWAQDLYGTMQFPYMRAAEMLLTEAEAAYYNSDATTATNCLKELNLKRDPQYSFSGSGDAIKNEIIRSRKLELWGEGHSFFDTKRWNIDIVRRPWVAGDNTSSNWRDLAAHDIKADDPTMCGWCFPIPETEFRNNPAANRAACINGNK